MKVSYKSLAQLFAMGYSYYMAAHVAQQTWRMK